MFPNIKFIGADRQEFIAKLNRNAYESKNLSFEHGDILKTIKKVGKLPGKKALVHVRTTCTVYPKFVEKLYQNCFEHQFSRIFFIETAGMCFSDLQFRDFSHMKELSVLGI